VRVFALIPAAGKSQRMGRPKLSLPLGEKTVLEHVIAAVKAAGVAHVLVVVVAPHVAELATLAEAAGADAFRLAEETPDMRATIERGLDWLETHYHPRPDDAWLLLPADHPTMSPVPIQPLLRAAEADAKASVFVPIYQGKRGHPTLIRWRLTGAIHALRAGAGLNALFRAVSDEVMELPTDCADVVRDMDTPEDYEALQKRYADPS
jgi:molybdenum cofactor cytidylyltransferase